MKVKIGKQEAAYNDVKRYKQENNCSLKDALIAVANKNKTTVTSVQAAYYNHARRNGEVVRRPKASSTTAAPPKKTKTTKIKKVKQAKQQSPGFDANLDVNVVRASLESAMRAIDYLESENRLNRSIIAGLRDALNA